MAGESVPILPCPFIRGHSSVPVHPFRFIRSGSSEPVHLCRFIRAYSSVPFHPRADSAVPIHPCRFIRADSAVPIHATMKQAEDANQRDDSKCIKTCLNGFTIEFEDLPWRPGAAAVAPAAMDMAILADHPKRKDTEHKN